MDHNGKRIRLGPQATELELTSNDVETMINQLRTLTDITSTMTAMAKSMAEVSQDQYVMARDLSVIKLFLASLATDEDQKAMLRLANDIPKHRGTPPEINFEDIENIVRQTQELLKATPERTAPHPPEHSAANPLNKEHKTTGRER